MKSKILLADDNDLVRTLHEKILSRITKYEIESFSDGTSLKNRLEQDVSDVALVLTDNDMPGSNGSEIIRDYVGLGLPFILVYGGEEEIGEQAVRDGAFSYMQKPVSLEILKREIDQAVEEYSDR